MVSYPNVWFDTRQDWRVLILVVVDNGLVRVEELVSIILRKVLILIVVDNSLVHRLPGENME